MKKLAQKTRHYQEIGGKKQQIKTSCLCCLWQPRILGQQLSSREYDMLVISPETGCHCDINLATSFWCIKACLKTMKLDAHGSIIRIKKVFLGFKISRRPECRVSHQHFLKSFSKKLQTLNSIKNSYKMTFLPFTWYWCVHKIKSRTYVIKALKLSLSTDHSKRFTTLVTFIHW